MNHPYIAAVKRSFAYRRVRAEIARVAASDAWLETGYVFVSFDATLTDSSGSGPQFLFVLTPDAVVVRAAYIEGDRVVDVPLKSSS